MSRVGGLDATGTADATAKRVRADQGVTLFAAVEVAPEGGGKHRWYSDAGTIKLGGKPVTTAPIADAPAFTIRWSKIEPTVADMSNEASGQFRFEAIDYAATAWRDGVAAAAADVHPTLTPDHGDGVGTMRYQVEVTQGDRVVASPGVEARRGRGAGGLTDAVARVSLRRDDTYLGYLTEMYGQPYIWASAGSTDATHQSERLEGSDCADFVVYGARRMGKKIPYVYTGALPRYARTLAAGTVGDDGIYRDADGDEVPFTGVGDLILFPRHVGVLTEDRGTPGVLDVDDIMMHTLFDSPKEQRIGDSGYAETAVQLLRWKK
ncbi:MAG: hypothetical protein H6708_24400 [Kofleriaceae bacterium]|nr:hypothetical protein [Kofleriaceae bacterium]